MKTSGAVYKKLKEIKFRHLIVLYRTLLKRVPDNCKYNYGYDLISKGETHHIRLCLCHQWDQDLPENNNLRGVLPHLVDICNEVSDCQNCNAFAPKYNRDQIKELFEEELKTKEIREKKYPDICALDWVLERCTFKPSIFSIIKEKILNFLQLKNDRSAS